MFPLVIPTEGGGKVQFTMPENRDPGSRVGAGNSFLEDWPSSLCLPFAVTRTPGSRVPYAGFRSFRPCRAYREAV